MIELILAILAALLTALPQILRMIETIVNRRANAQKSLTQRSLDQLDAGTDKLRTLQKQPPSL